MKKIDALKERYRELISNYWKDEGMVKHCMGSYSLLFELDGGICAIEKPGIKTNFCFGYSLNQHDRNEFDEANEMAAYASKSVDYFMSENLKEFKRWIKDLKEAKKGYSTWYPVIGNKYCGKCDGLKSVRFVYCYDDRNKDRRLTNDEIDKVIEAYEKSMELFVKRLKTYLKRYGLTKVNTWSYWRDE